uniref:Uncharacterized protein n=1 Tax=Clytia hemisphaerica TaxID=252671 RepID=A0A7M5XA81_9CNID
MMDDKRFLPLWLKIFKLVFENEEFGNRWWDKIISCEDLVNKEFDIISHICLNLPIETNPVKFPSLLTALVTSMTTEDNPYCVKRYAEKLLDVIAKIKGSEFFESALTNLSNQLVSEGRISTLIKLAELCAPKDQHSRHNEEVVKLFLEGCFDWLSKATFERKHIQSVVDIVVLLNQHKQLYNGPMIEKYIESCQKISDPDFICNVVNKLFTMSCSFYFLKPLLQSLANLLSTKTFTDHKAMSSTINHMFIQGPEFDHLLTLLLTNEKILSSIDLLNEILHSLLSKDDNIEQLKTSINFHGLLTSFVSLMQQPNNTNKEFSSLRLVHEFLLSLSDESPLHQLVPQIIDTSLLKNDFPKCIQYLSKLSIRETETFKTFLTTTIHALGIFLRRYNTIIDAEYQLIYDFIKLLLKNDHFTPFALQLASLKDLTNNDYRNLYHNNKERSVLENLLAAFKNHRNTDFFAALQLSRSRSLQMLKDYGPPKFTWEQPDVNIDHAKVQEFLRSKRETIVLRTFRSYKSANNWIQKHSGYNKDRKYSFTAQIRTANNGWKSLVDVKKGRHIHEEREERFQNLMNELEEILESLKISNVENPLAA